MDKLLITAVLLAVALLLPKSKSKSEGNTRTNTLNAFPRRQPKLTERERIFIACGIDGTAIVDPHIIIPLDDPDRKIIFNPTRFEK